MPTYEFICKVETCKHEWEEFLSIKAPIPEECPSCKTKGEVMRLISGGSGKGVVELTGNELIAKTKEDTKALRKKIYTDEKVLANFVGESKYERNLRGK